MAGEIQIGGTTFATESGGTVTVSNVNSATNRTNLGLGSIATQAADSVSISGGNITGGTIGSGVVFPAGHIVQLEKGVLTTQVQTSTNDTWTSMGLSVAITPKYSNSLIYVSYTSGVAGAGLDHVGTKVVRTGPATSDLSVHSTYDSDNEYYTNFVAYSSFDSPNTDSVECTYTVWFYIDENASTNFVFNYEGTFQSESYIVAMEVKQ